jgi:hypothetical protein
MPFYKSIDSNMVTGRRTAERLLALKGGPDMFYKG